MQNFKIKNVSKAFIRKLANCYTADISFTFQMLGNHFNITPKAVSNLLYRGIAEDIIPDTQAEVIYHKVVHCTRKCQNQRIKRWERAFDERLECRKKQLAEAAKIASEVTSS